MNKLKYNNAKIFCIFNNDCKKIMYIGYTQDENSYFITLRCRMSDNFKLKTKSISNNSLSLFIRYVRFKDVMWNFEVIDTISCNKIEDIRNLIKYWEKKMNDYWGTEFINHRSTYNQSKDDFNLCRREYYHKRKKEGKIKKFVSSEQRRTKQREIYHNNKDRYALYRKKYRDRKKLENAQLLTLDVL